MDNWEWEDLGRVLFALVLTVLIIPTAGAAIIMAWKLLFYLLGGGEL